MIEALIVGSALAVGIATPAVIWVLLPENRRRREGRAQLRDLDRAAARKHTHTWGKWSDPVLQKVYASRVTKETMDTAIPIQVNHLQERTCDTCGAREERAY